MARVRISELQDGGQVESDVYEADSWAQATLIVASDLIRTAGGNFNRAVMEKWLTLHDGEGSFMFTHEDDGFIWEWRYDV